jgi:membrane-associated phospholipid phosphatase
MANLHAIDATTPLTALWAQNVLWQSYIDPGAAQVEGISAMPSMHVAMATLMALIAFRVNRRLGWAYTVYAGLIFLGSIHLGWHYALDGYVGALGTIGIWYLAGRITAAWERRRESVVRAA